MHTLILMRNLSRLSTYTISEPTPLPRNSRVRPPGAEYVSVLYIHTYV